MADTAQQLEKGASHPSTHWQPYPAQVMQPPYNATANRRPTYMRLLYGIAVAALVWFVGNTFLRSVVYFFPSQELYPIPSHLTLENCVSYDEWSSLPVERPDLGLPFAAVTTLDLPLSTETLLLLSRGPNSGGSVEIVTSSEQDQDVVTVEVVANYLMEDDRDDAKVCQIHPEDGGIGVGIFTRRRPSPYNRLRFATKVILPELSDGSPLLIKKFETDVPNTAHKVSDLNEKVIFQSLDLKGSNARIDVQSVKVDQGTIKTSNAGISGVYNTSSLLILTTSNGRVQTDIGLSSINASEPKLILATSNAALESRISLISEKGIGGSFDVTTGTSNGRLDIDFPAAPPDSILKFAGKTSNAPVAVSLNPAYEGSFLLETSNFFKAQIHRDRTVVDPSGRNRKRSLNFKQARRNIASGEVFWDDATEQEVSKAGTAFIHTSNAKINLNL